MANERVVNGMIELSLEVTDQSSQRISRRTIHRSIFVHLHEADYVCRF
jgi:hypothetical protein